MAKIRRSRFAGPRRTTWFTRIPLAVRVVAISSICIAVGFVMWNFERWVNPTTYWRDHATHIMYETELTCRAIRRGKLTSEDVERRLLDWADVADDFTRDVRPRASWTEKERKHLRLTTLIISFSCREVEYQAREAGIPTRSVFGFEPEIGPFAKAPITSE